MKRKLFWLSILLVVVLGVYFTLPLILEGMARFLIVRDKIEPAQLIIVLAGDNNGERVREAVKLYKEGYGKKMLMTGGPLAWKLTASEWMKKHALALGVPARAILLEDKSRSTLENALFILPILKKHSIKSVILVTSPTHSRRAKRVFKKCYSKEDIKVLSCPAREAEFELPGWWTRHEDTQRVMWEYVSLVYYFLKGY
ncbi:MAG: YdcF family protein [Candidatus Margulisiibacteriota bacterium]